MDRKDKTRSFQCEIRKEWRIWSRFVGAFCKGLSCDSQETKE